MNKEENELVVEKKERIPSKKILEILHSLYPDAHCELNFSTPFQLLIATILSAQTTDIKVNEVTRTLFAKYPTAHDYLTLSQEELEAEIRTIGLYKSKSKHILATCHILVEKYNGEVPKTREELEALPGVGRKTANVVLSNAFGIPAIAVDTHVFRVGNRLRLAKSDHVLETEEQLMKRIPKKLWSDAHHWLIWHGRRVCHARSPKCTNCELLPYCRFGKQEVKK